MPSNDDGETTLADRVGDHEVGYGKPPKHTRFRPGRSGNPSGRRKGVRNLKTDVKRTLKVPVRVKEGGRARKMSTQEGALMLLREMALRGDGRSLDRLLDFAARFNNDAADTGPAQAVSAEDQAILDAYAAEIAASIKPAAAAPLDGQAPNLDRIQDVDE